MNAVVFEGKKRLVLKSIPKPRVQSDEALLRIRSVGICGTDLHIYHGGAKVPPNAILGHEFSGEVVAVGKSVTNVKNGMRAVAEHVLSCGACWYCVRGKPNLCLKASIFGIDRPGALAEYMVIPARLIFPFPKAIPFEEAALIEPLTIALFAASQAGFLLEKQVAVIGQGPIGILLDQVLTAAGAHVVGVDVLQNRLDFVQKKGWTNHVLNSAAKDFAKQCKAVLPQGADAVFEAVGKDATADMSIDIARRDADVFLLGVFEKPATLDLMKIIKKELNIYGSWTCSFSFPAAIDLVVEKKVDLKSLITHRYAFRDAAKAFADADSYSGNRMKTVITFP